MLELCQQHALDSVLLNSPESAKLLIEREINSRTYGNIRALQAILIPEHPLLIIRGETQTYYAKQLATHAVLSLCQSQQIEVRNEIRVAEPEHTGNGNGVGMQKNIMAIESQR